MSDQYQSRVNAGVPSGGQFAAKQHSEADVALADAPHAARDSFEVLDLARWRVRQQLDDRAVAAAREAIAEQFPAAATFELEWQDGDWESAGHANLHRILDADGEVLFDVHEGDEENGDIGRYIDRLDDWETFRHLTDRASDLVVFTVRPEDDGDLALEHRRARMEDIRAWVEREEYQLTVDNVRRNAKLIAPDAAAVQLANANEGPGSPYFVVSAIESADGTVVWRRPEEDNAATESLDNYSAGLDRDMSHVESVDRGVWRFKF